jgi:hypothetical protein
MIELEMLGELTSEEDNQDDDDGVPTWREVAAGRARRRDRDVLVTPTASLPSSRAWVRHGALNSSPFDMMQRSAVVSIFAEECLERDLCGHQS